MKKELTAYLLFSVEGAHDILEAALSVCWLFKRMGYTIVIIVTLGYIAMIVVMRNAICSIVFNN